MQPPEERPSPLAPALSRAIQVRPGDDLAGAVAHAPPGSTVELLPGEHRLARPLVVDRDLTLLGAGAAVTRVTSAVGPAVVRFVGASWTVRGLTFAFVRPPGRHLPWRHWADVLVVERGRLVLEDCICEGGRGQRWLPFMPYFELFPLRGGRGAWVGKQGHLTARRCVFRANTVYGLEASGPDAFDLAECRLAENWDSGLACFKDGGGRLEGCVSEENGFHGVALKGRASVTLVANTIRDNDLNGLHYADRAGGEARDNRIERNNADGVRVEGRAAPLLLSNAVRSNKQGLVFRENAAGEAQENVVELNTKDGVLVRDRATPALLRNRLLENGGHGLAYLDKGGGSARSNELRDNALPGVARAATCRADVDAYTLGAADELAPRWAALRAQLAPQADSAAAAEALAALYAFAPRGNEAELAAWLLDGLREASPQPVDGHAGQHDAEPGPGELGLEVE